MAASLSPKPRSVQRAAAVRALRCVTLATLCASLAACGTLDYYLQAARGQWQIWRREQPIATALTRTDLSPTLRAKLELVERARGFAHTALALPDHGSYRSFARLDRDYVVWNVFAAPALSLTPVKSCFPLLGCVDYRGYFSEARARLAATTLAAQGYDTFVGGVAAYSTLGWFEDPVLDTVLRSDDLRIVETLFHELAHQVLYIADDTAFNEGFAMTVAQIGVERWLADDAPARARHAESQAREQAFLALLMRYRARLATLYASSEPDPARHAAKQALFAELAADYARLRDGWGGYDGYDAWMGAELNNAKLASVATYHDEVEHFLALYQRCGDDLPRFYRAVERLGRLPPATRRACLRDASGPACARLADPL